MMLNWKPLLVFSHCGEDAEADDADGWLFPSRRHFRRPPLSLWSLRSDAHARRAGCAAASQVLMHAAPVIPCRSCPLR
jgi:hypothetical protein